MMSKAVDRLRKLAKDSNAIAHEAEELSVAEALWDRAAWFNSLAELVEAAELVAIEFEAESLPDRQRCVVDVLSQRLQTLAKLQEVE